MHPDPISSALTKDNRKESKRNHRRERQDINTTSRCVVWAGLKLILLPCPPFFLLSCGDKRTCLCLSSTQQQWLGPNPHRAQGPVGGRREEEGPSLGRPREPGRYGRGGPDEFEGFLWPAKSWADKPERDGGRTRPPTRQRMSASSMKRDEKWRRRPRAAQGRFSKAISGSLVFISLPLMTWPHVSIQRRILIASKQPSRLSQTRHHLIEGMFTNVHPEHVHPIQTGNPILDR